MGVHPGASGAIPGWAGIIPALAGMSPALIQTNGTNVQTIRTHFLTIRTNVQHNGGHVLVSGTNVQKNGTNVRNAWTNVPSSWTKAKADYCGMASFIPRPDGGFDAWQQNFVTYAAAHYVEWDLDSTVVTELLVARGNWEFVHGKHVSAQAAAIAARQAKDEGRAGYEKLIREVVRRIQAHVKTSDAQRGHLGITIADRQATPVGAPTSRPLVKVDFSQRLAHRIAFADEKTPTRRTKPKGVMGAEVWVKVTAPGEAPPSGPADLRFLLLATRSPAIAEYGGADAGKTAHYMVRWLSRRGEPGPWSETASATVGA